MICLGREDTDTDVLKLLNTLMSTKTDSEEKCQILEEAFNIKMTQTLERELTLMCNLSKGVAEESRKEGIIAMVSALRELDIADSVILKKLCEKFNLTEENAKTYL